MREEEVQPVVKQDKHKENRAEKVVYRDHFLDNQIAELIEKEVTTRDAEIAFVKGEILGEGKPLGREFSPNHYRGDISELELYFVIVNNEYGEQTEEELLPGGRNLRVTNDNVITFIHLVANHRLNFQIRQQSSHFLRGFQQLIQKDWIDMFNEHELQLLISGSLDSLDIDDLRLHTNYAGGYHSEHYVIEIFWEVLKGFSLENRKKFLKFVTGCSRGPLLGFRHLEPLFCIQRASGNTSEESLDRLPTSATCMNLLKLPPYASKEQLETKLLYAINAEAGFDLS